jgi:hypothetical protein
MEDHRQKNIIKATKLKNKHTDDLVDHYWASISYLQDLIKSSELKAGLILSFYGILLNLLYQSKASIAEIQLNIFAYGLIGLWAVCSVLSIFFCVRCFMPKIEGKFDNNMFFFKDIISQFGGVKAFSKHFFEASCDEDQLFSQLGEQIFIISKIADWKFKNVHRAITLLAVGLSVLFLIALYYIVI